jgi:uncharacterized protein YndB with AHSA1/START domain
MSKHPHDDEMAVVREIVIAARKATVFRFFTDSALWAQWWGAGSTVEPVAGGRVVIVHPGNVRATGVVRELVAGERFAFTYGYEGEGKPIPPGGSLVTIELAEAPGGTRVTLRHSGLPSRAVASEHEQGWRFQMSRFSAAASSTEQGDLAAKADLWMSVWGESDAGKRAAALDAASDDVTFHDRYSALFGKADVDAHAAAAAVHMPGVRLFRAGDVLASHGTALVRFEARKDGGVVGKGTNVMRFAPDGRIAAVTGFWEA